MGLVTADIAISLDGFTAGPNQTLENPMGEGIDGRLHRWMFEEPEKNAEALDKMSQHGAYIMGRNMFGPVRDGWDSAPEWNGWWGDEPPYHAPVFVLTHYEREPLVMGETTFYFITDGIESAFSQARDAAGEGSIAIAGGADTIRQYLSAGLIDELRLHLTPAIIGKGERLLDGLEGIQLEPIQLEGNSLVTHMTYKVHHS